MAGLCAATLTTVVATVVLLVGCDANTDDDGTAPSSTPAAETGGDTLPSTSPPFPTSSPPPTFTPRPPDAPNVPDLPLLMPQSRLPSDPADVD